MTAEYPTPEQEAEANRRVIEAVRECKKIILAASRNPTHGNRGMMSFTIMARLMAEIFSHRTKMKHRMAQEEPVEFMIGASVQALIEFNKLDQFLLAAYVAKDMLGKGFLDGAGWLDIPSLQEVAKRNRETAYAEMDREERLQ